MERMTTDNPVPVARLMELAGKARQGQITAAEGQELQALKIQATRQGRAVGAVIGFFLKLKPYPMLAEIRQKAKLFQPAFGPVLVVEGDAVRNVLERDQEFTVDPYGVEMVKVMTPSRNGGLTTFILSTDDNAAYEPDKRLLSAVCNREDAARITDTIHEDCVRRVGAALAFARRAGSSTIGPRAVLMSTAVPRILCNAERSIMWRLVRLRSQLRLMKSERAKSSSRVVI